MFPPQYFCLTLYAWGINLLLLFISAEDPSDNESDDEEDEEDEVSKPSV